MMTPDTDPLALRSQLRSDLTRAMKARERDAVSALRTALAAIDNAEAVPAADSSPAAGSGPIAGASAGVGATEAARRLREQAQVLSAYSSPPAGD